VNAFNPSSKLSAIACYCLSTSSLRISDSGIVFFFFLFISYSFPTSGILINPAVLLEIFCYYLGQNFVYLSISTLVWLLGKQLNIYIYRLTVERPFALARMLMNIVVLRLCIQCGRPESEREGKNRREHSDRTRKREKDCPIFLSVLSFFLFHRRALAFSHSLLPLTATIIIITTNETADFIKKILY
jgi:hypothetical protein